MARSSAAYFRAVIGRVLRCCPLCKAHNGDNVTVFATKVCNVYIGHCPPISNVIWQDVWLTQSGLWDVTNVENTQTHSTLSWLSVCSTVAHLSEDNQNNWCKAILIFLQYITIFRTELYHGVASGKTEPELRNNSIQTIAKTSATRHTLKNSTELKLK